MLTCLLGLNTIPESTQQHDEQIWYHTCRIPKTLQSYTFTNTSISLLVRKNFNFHHFSSLQPQSSAAQKTKKRIERKKKHYITFTIKIQKGVTLYTF